MQDCQKNIPWECSFMKKKLFEDKEFVIYHTNRDYILIRKNGGYAQHSHFDRFSGAKLLIDLFYKKVVPYNPYFKEAMERICYENEICKFKEEKVKQKYYNSNGKRGVRK